MSYRNGPKYLETGAKARTLYIDEGKPLSDISRLTGVSEVTLRKWRDAEKWDDLRKTRIASSVNVSDKIQATLAVLVSEMELLATAGDTGERLMTLIDRISKLNGVLQRVDRSVDFLGISKEVLDVILGVLAKSDAELARRFDQHLDRINRDLIDRYREIRAR